MGTYNTDDFDYEGIDIEGIAEEEVEKAAIKHQNNWKQNLRDEGWVASGEGVNDITVEQTSDGFRVGTDVIQNLIAEYGRAPNNTMPPEAPIRDWANEKNIQPEEGQSLDDVIYLIRRAIAEDGIEGFSPGRNAARQTINELEASLDERLNEEMPE